MSVQVYSVPGQTEGSRKEFLKWTSIDLPSKLSLTSGGNVNYYKNVHHPIPTLPVGIGKNPGNSQNKSLRSPFISVSKYFLFLAKLKGRGRHFLEGSRKGATLWEWCDRTKITKYKLRVTSSKFESTSENSKVQVQIHEFKITSYEFKSKSFRIIWSVKTQVNSLKSKFVRQFVRTLWRSVWWLNMWVQSELILTLKEETHFLYRKIILPPMICTYSCVRTELMVSFSTIKTKDIRISYSLKYKHSKK